MYRIVLLAGGMGCGGSEECDAGFELGDDGLCYEIADEEPAATSDSATTPEDVPDPVDILTAEWPACDATTGNGEIDLEAGCVIGICELDTYEEVVLAVGEPVDTYDYEGSIFAVWLPGVGVYFVDLDLDGQPDPDALVYYIIVTADVDLQTDDGLGPGAPMSCFLDTFGDPDFIGVDDRTGDWQILYMDWYGPSVRAYDFLNGSFEGSDGLADWLYVAYN
jgi:hypothetical protein